MSIKVEEHNRFFSIRTDHTEYQMFADRLGVLRHLWYGEITETNMDYLQSYPDVGFSGNPNDAGDERTYSLDTLPLEYACDGVGDYRIPAISVCCGGVKAVDLRYVGYVVRSGKYAIPGLPAAYAAPEEAETLEITLEDCRLGLTAVLRYGVFPKLDIITRCVTLFHRGTQPLQLEKAASVCFSLPRREWEWVHFSGRHTLERQPKRAALFAGIQESASTRGTSSHQQNPAILLCEPACTETSGACFGAMLVYSGSFQAQIELDQLGQARLVMGIHPDLFQWELPVGGRFDTPEAVLCYSANGFQTLSHRYHTFIRKHICRGKYQFGKRPVLINNWEATYWHFHEEDICAIAKDAADLGVELMVLDDGWFGKRNGDRSGLGDWTADRSKLPDGLEGLSKKIRALGMKLGIWLEPEAVSEDSELYRTHPDWVLQVPERPPVRGRFQLMLDLSRQEVEDYLYHAVSAVLRESHAAYLKWDMNRSFCDWYSSSLPPDRMGELPHRYMLGLYSLLERLNAAFPDVLFEGCSGGGGRFDAGMLYYFPQIWCSDDTDAYERTKIQYGTSFFYPISAVGSHVSDVPNQQTGRTTPLAARAVAAMPGSFGYELDPRQLSSEEKQDIKGQIAYYQKHQDLIYSGRYYRLSDPIREPWAAWEFVSEDCSEALVQGIMFRTEPNALRPIWRLQGLAAEKRYCLDGDPSKVFTGAALMYGGLLVPATWGDSCAVTIEIREMRD